MPDRADSGPGVRRRGWRARVTGLVMSVAMMSGGAVLIAPGTAYAGVFGPDIACPTDPNIVWTTTVAARNTVVYQGHLFTVSSSNRTFIASDGRTVDNGLSSPIVATFTSQQSRTYTVTTRVGTSAQLTNKLQTSVSVDIVNSRTTAIGVNAQVTVPAYSRVLGLYGVEVYDVAYTAQTVWMNLPRSKCWDRGTQAATTAAPTLIEGWRFTAG
nr:hypothetical protein [Micromonospora sp. DSM 115978]